LSGIIDIGTAAEVLLPVLYSPFKHSSNFSIRCKSWCGKKSGKTELFPFALPAAHSALPSPWQTPFDCEDCVALPNLEHRKK